MRDKNLKVKKVNQMTIKELKNRIEKIKRHGKSAHLKHLEDMLKTRSQ